MTMAKFIKEKKYRCECGMRGTFDDYYFWDGQRRATDDFFKSRNINYNFVNIGNFKTAAIIKK